MGTEGSMMLGMTSIRLRISSFSWLVFSSSSCSSWAMAVTWLLVSSASSRLPWAISLPICLLMVFRWERR